MNIKESKSLKIGDKVVFEGKNGEITENNPSGVAIRWENGEEGYVFHYAMWLVSRAKQEIGGTP